MLTFSASAKPLLLALAAALAAASAAAQGPIYINELLASNQEGAEDEAGQTEDWIELYNASDAPFSLAGYTISDDPERPDKWPFPAEAVVPARGFLIVWADEDQEDGPLHANFKLARGGETVTLSDAGGGEVDAVTFPEVEQDVAYARRADGGGPFVTQAPTFGSPNDGSSSVADADAYPGLEAWPNPVTRATDGLTASVPAGARELSLTDALGREVWATAIPQPTDAERASVVRVAGALASGTYVLTATGEAGYSSLRVIVR